MLIKQEMDVAQPLDKVWEFFQDVPGIANCLPGANISQDLGDDKYAGGVLIRMGPVKLVFDGTAQIVQRDEANKRVVVDAAGAEKNGRGNANMNVDAKLVPLGGNTRVNIALDLVLSGAIAQYGRGMVADVTAVMIDQFKDNMQARFTALEKGLDPNAVGTAKPASGLALGIKALQLALMRVVKRFFYPYAPPA